MKIITVTGYKGGVGKSTTALHLAAYLSDFGSTLLIDGDANRTALAWAERGSLGFQVVPAHASRRASVGKDFIIIDTAARPDSDELKELAEEADILVFPTRPDVVSVEPMVQMMVDIGSATYRVLLTVVPPAPVKDGEEVRAALLESDIQVFERAIRRSIGFQRAAQNGMVLRDLKDANLRRGWLDYEAVGEELLSILEKQ